MKKKIKLFLSKLNLLLYLNNIVVFFKKDKEKNQKFNDFLSTILDLFQKNNIELIPFFGTLLGIYREGGVISYDNDIDFAILHNKETKSIINFLNSNNFIKVLDCSILETNELTLEKYKYKNFEIDIFYIYENDNHYYFYDNESDSGLSTIEEINNSITVHPYINKISKFNIENLKLNGFQLFSASNNKLLLNELYGDKFMKPDKFWRQRKRLNREQTNFKIKINEY